MVLAGLLLSVGSNIVSALVIGLFNVARNSGRSGWEDTASSSISEHVGLDTTECASLNRWLHETHPNELATRLQGPSSDLIHELAEAVWPANPAEQGTDVDVLHESRLTQAANICDALLPELLNALAPDQAAFIRHDLEQNDIKEVLEMLVAYTRGDEATAEYVYHAYELLRRADRRLPLQLPSLALSRLDGTASRDRLPSTLLRAQRGVIPLTGREALMHDFSQWCDGDPMRTRIVFGGGGAGKTRFAAELCHQQRRQGWRTGFLVDDASQEEFRRLGESSRPRMIVVDYASTRSADLDYLARSLRSSRENRVRLLLLVRSKHDPMSELGKAALTAAGEELIQQAEVVDETAFALDHDDLAALFDAACAAFARRLDMDLGEAQRPEVIENPLDAACKALLQVLGTPAGIDPFTGVLNHELRHWRRAAEARMDRVDVETLQRVAAVLGVVGAEDEQSAAEMLEVINELRGDQGLIQRHAHARWVAELYGTEETFIRPIEPDLVAEKLLLDVTASAEQLVANLFNLLIEKRDTVRIRKLLAAAVRVLGES